jgi:hypothetical protein
MAANGAFERVREAAAKVSSPNRQRSLCTEESLV